MRKLILLAVAFLLLAAPAWANVSDSATATVTITTVESITVTGDWQMDVDTQGEYTNGVTSNAPVVITGYANYLWEITAQITTDWAVTPAQGWTLELDNDIDNTWETVTTTVGDFIDSQAASGSIDIDVDAKVTSLAWGDVSDVCTVTFTLKGED